MIHEHTHTPKYQPNYVILYDVERKQYSSRTEVSTKKFHQKSFHIKAAKM